MKFRNSYELESVAFRNYSYVSLITINFLMLAVLHSFFSFYILIWFPQWTTELPCLFSWLVEWHSSAELVCLEEGMGAMGKANGLSSLEVAQLSAEASRWDQLGVIFLFFKVNWSLHHSSSSTKHYELWFWANPVPLDEI